MRRNGNPMHATGAGLYGREPRTRGHICGNCRWQGQGRDDCPNNRRASQTVPYEPDVEQLIDDYKDRVQARSDVEADRQRGYEI